MVFGIPGSVLHYALAGLYVLCLAGLFLYGTNCYLMLFLFSRHRLDGLREYRAALRRFRRSPWVKEPPTVTVQLPIYNERYVIQRLLEAVCSLDYPRDRLEIQVLDDSTDDTADIVRRLVAHYQKQGLSVVHIRRGTRQGFKAGALKEGLERARGEFIAIFDADFVPSPDFLRKTIPYFCDPRAGMVQARWGHTNADYSLLTRAQSVGIDGHFSIEQGARAWSGLFLNFNGTAGVWRSQAIRDAGGWQADTLTEDMDLSYRAQLAGWRLKYVMHVSCPAELPVQVGAFKSQQFRWAKGSMQTARKILPALLRAPCPPLAKYQAVIHLTHYMIHPLMVASILLSFPIVLLNHREPSPWLIAAAFFLFALSTFGPSALYVVSQRVLYADWRTKVRWIPLLTLVGTGIALNNSRAVLGGLFFSGGRFIRTPKLGVRRKGDGRSRGGDYRLKLDLFVFLELAVGFYALLALGQAVTTRGIWITPFLFIYACGFLFVSLSGIAEGLPWSGWPSASKRQNSLGEAPYGR